MQTQGKYLVLAWGDAGRGDCAAGVAIAESLTDLVSDDVEIRCFQELGPELAADVAAADHVIFIDAHGHPGWPDLVVEEVEPSARYSLQSQGSGPEELIALSEVIYQRRPDAWLVATRAFDTLPGAGLSPRGLKLADAARRIILSMLPTIESSPAAQPGHDSRHAYRWN